MFVGTFVGCLSVASVGFAQAVPEEPVPTPPGGYEDATPAEGDEDDEAGGGIIVVEQEPGASGTGELQPVPHPDQPAPHPSQPAPVPEGYGQPTPQPQPGWSQPGPQRYSPPRYHREPYVEGQPLPPGARVITRARTGLVASGTAMLAAGYVAMLFSYLFADAFGDPTEWMLVPLVGPFFTIPHAGASEGRGLLALDGLLQVGGLTMFIAGLVAKRSYVVWYGDSGVRVRPLASTRGGGLELSYAF